MTNTYEFGSDEFQPIILTKHGLVVTPVPTDVQYVIVPKGTDLIDGLPQAVAVVDGELGFWTTGLTRGYWRVGVRVQDFPGAPLIHAGYIRIK